MEDTVGTVLVRILLRFLRHGIGANCKYMENTAHLFFDGTWHEVHYIIFEPDTFFFVFTSTKSQQFYENIFGQEIRLVYQEGQEAFLSIGEIEINQFGTIGITGKLQTHQK